MADEDEVVGILISLVEIGVLRIRALANAGNLRECQIEAAHLHNIPVLIRSFSWDRLYYYYDIERASFLSATACNTTQYVPAWQALEGMIIKRRPK